MGRTILFLVLLTTQFALCQTDTIYLWPDQVPNENHAKSHPVQTPDTSRGVVRITDITNPAVRIFSPSKEKRNHAAIIICPGGGYSYLAVNIEGDEIAKWLNQLGYTAFVLEYRTPDNRLGALNDIQRAIRTVRKKASDFHIDPDKIGVMGFSAGGNLSLLASTNYLEDSYAATDAIDMESSRPDFALLLYPAYLDDGPDKTLSENIRLHKDIPPMFLFGTFDDFLSNGFFVLGKALNDRKASIEMHLYEKGGHGYGMRPGNPAAEAWPKLAAAWLKKVIER